MKTDELVEALSRHVEPVDFRVVGRRIALAAFAGLAVAVTAILIGFGSRPDLSTFRAWTFLIVKIAFAAAIAVAGIGGLIELSRPGSKPKHGLLAVILPFLIIVTFALASLGSAPVSHWDRMVTGHALLECLLSIPIIAIVPFALIPRICAAQEPSPDSSRAGSARWPMHFIAPTIRCPLSRFGTAEQSWSALWRVQHLGRDCCDGEIFVPIRQGVVTRTL
jgi:hypothetical protein